MCEFCDNYCNFCRLCVNKKDGVCKMCWEWDEDDPGESCSAILCCVVSCYLMLRVRTIRPVHTHMRTHTHTRHTPGDLATVHEADDFWDLINITCKPMLWVGYATATTPTTLLDVLRLPRTE